MNNNSVIDNFYLLPDFEDEWRNIHKASSSQSIFSSFDYVKMWYSCFARPEDVRVYRIRQNGKTIGFMPLVMTRTNGFRELRNLFNDHCANPTPLFLDGFESIFQEVLLNELINDKHGWDFFRNGFSYSFSTLPGLFYDEYLTDTKIKWHKLIMPTYSIDMSISFEEYQGKVLSKKSRSNIRLLNNRLSNIENYEFFHYYGNDSYKYWPLFLNIEGSGWKGENGSSINKTNSGTQEYYNKLVKLLACSGKLHLYFLVVKEEVIAGAFGFSESDIFHYSKSGYDERYSDLGPTTLLYLYLLQDIMRTLPSIRRFHFFPWDYGYKHRFSNESQECIETLIFSPTLRGSMAYNFRRLKTEFMSLYNKMRHQENRNVK